MGVSPQFGHGVFPVGTHIYREPSLPIGELLSDLPLLKRLGFNLIKIQESWAFNEPSAGIYDFSQIEQLIARAGELDLGVYLGLTMEQAPAWLWRDFPDCRLVYASGRPHDDPTPYCLPGDGKPGPCWDHPGARAAAERFIGVLAKRLGRFQNIWCWNTFQETGWWPNDGGALGFCYCPHTLESYRSWLKSKYASLEALNLSWRTAYGDWASIVPSRRESFVPSHLDWRYFMDDVVLTRNLEWKTAALRRHDPFKRPVFSHVGPYQAGSTAEWRYARVADFWGNSNYPGWTSLHPWDALPDQGNRLHAILLHEIWDGVMFRSEMMRCAGGRDRAFWGAEFQGGPIAQMLQLGRVPSAHDMRRWVFAGLASGMTGLSFWNHRSEILWGEGHGFGLLDREGQTSERMEEAGRLARAVQAHGNLFSQAQVPRAPVAILLDEDLWHFAQGSPGHVAELMSYNLRGWYARLWRMGISCDFLDREQIVSGDLNHYRTALLPMPLALGADYFAYLQRWVEAGGTLISEACPGRFGRNGICPPGQMVAGAAQVFGCRQAWVKMVREPGETRRWTPDERSFVELLEAVEVTDANRGRFWPGFYLQALTPTTGQAIFTAGEDGTTVGVSNAWGRGHGILIGTFAGLMATAGVSSDDAAFERLFGTAGVEPQRFGDVILRKRETDDGRAIWFLINPTPHQASVDLKVTGLNISGLMPEDEIRFADGRAIVAVPAASLAVLIVRPQALS